jgi:hypothetical protein
MLRNQLGKAHREKVGESDVAETLQKVGKTRTMC